MKIVYIYTAILEVGGVDRILTQKANYLAEKMGHEVYVITDSQAGKPTTFPLSPLVKHIDLDVDFDQQYRHGLLLRTWYYFTLMREYKKRLKAKLMELRPDVTITVLGREMDFLMKIKDGSRKVGESHIAKQFCRNFHLLEQRSFPYPMIARHWRRKQEKAVAKLDELVLLTEHDRESWQDAKEGVVIPNAVAFYPNESSTLNRKRCITVGRFTEQKGYDLLIQAWSLVAKKHPDWVIDCYGQGDKSHFQKLIEEQGLQQQVRLHEASATIMQEYLDSSIYVMSSRFEGFGLVLVEAMACGVPCVSFDCPHGPSDIITDGEDGLLVKHLDVEALAQSICKMIENEEMRKAMGAAAKRNVARYKEECIMQRWEELFKKGSKRVVKG
ncbi:MAG: glycosyltransferase family 4 protein [Bacteroidales bacterium]|nr:glycosyltransferase family 4 protein [Bacteroidales bacterium]